MQPLQQQAQKGLFITTANFSSGARQYVANLSGLKIVLIDGQALTKLMINCGKEEIQALVYDANKKGIKKENLNEYVLEKIAMTLPQDILINLKIAGPKQ